MPKPQRQPRRFSSVTDWQVLDAVRAADGNQAAAARSLRVEVTAFRGRLKRIRQRIGASHSIERLWLAYHKEPKDDVIRNAIVEHYHHLVKKVHSRLVKRLPECADVGSIQSEGYIALIASVERFDLAKSDAKFSTYAEFRIRGATLDELRNQDVAPRLIRAAYKVRLNAERQLQHELGRQPTERELADVMDVDERVLTSRKPVKAISTETVLWHNSRLDATLGNTLIQSERPRLREQIQRIERWTRGLDLISRMFIVHYYANKITMKEIGDMLDLSESRCSQIHSHAMKFLRKARSRDEMLDEMGE